jgi:hypothetical protein
MVPSMESRSLPDAIKTIMQAHGWSQAKLAREMGVSDDWLSKAKRADRDPSIGRVIKLLAGIGWEVVIRPKREEPDPVKRREFVAAAASVMFVPSPKTGPYEDPAHVRELARRVASAWYEHGGGTIAPTAMRHVRRVEPALAGRDRQLQEAASELAVQTVWTLNDARLFNAGENVGRLALELAKRSENADAQSRAYSALAAINAERGSADRALIYAGDGVTLPEVPEAQHAWMRLRRARTQAAVGPAHRRLARDELEGIAATLRDTPGFPGQSSFDVANMMGSVGRGLSEVGAHEAAHETLDEAVRLMGGSAPNFIGLNLVELTLAALGMAEPALAAHHMQALVRVAPMVNSRRLDDSLRRVLAASAPWAGVPDVRDARNHLKALIPPDARAKCG